MKVIADLHTHSLASDHAYSTLLENVLHASKIGLEVLALTDHAPALIDAPHMWHFSTMKSTLPKYIEGVRILSGVELNILDFDGNIDLPDNILKNLDVVIASCHESVLSAGSIEEHTKMWLNIAKNPLIKIIGHSGNPIYSYNVEAVIKEFKKYEKIVEINAHSVISRKGSEKNCLEIAKMCKKYEVPIVVNSDAHIALSVGDVNWSMELLKSIDFPSHLNLSLNKEDLFKHLSIKN